VSDPRPLATPDGVVIAYACGACMRIGHGGRSLAEDREARIRYDRADSYGEALGCCVCEDCGVATSDGAIACPVCYWRHRWSQSWGAVAAAVSLGINYRGGVGGMAQR
jgi:hypothetical protein